MHVVLADSRLLWRVIDYLQRDAATKDILLCSDDSTVGSFWHNMDEFTPAKREDRLYVVLDTRHRLMAYFITRRTLENDESDGAIPTDKGTLFIDIFEVLPKYRNKDVGSFMVSWIEGKACTAGYHSLSVLPANSSNAFWNKKGFGVWPGSAAGYLLLPIA